MPCGPPKKGRSPPLPRRSPKQYLLISVTWCLPFRPTPGERVRLSLSSRTIPHDCSRGKWKASILGSPIDSNLALDCREHSTGGARYPIIPGGQCNWNLEAGQRAQQGRTPLERQRAAGEPAGGEGPRDATQVAKPFAVPEGQD